MARGGAEAAVPGWPAPTWRAFVAALAHFAPAARERGRRYAEEGRVESIDVRDDVVEATVVGSEAYDVVWEHDRGEWRASCSCPVGSFCKHAYAVARCLVADSTLAPPAARPPAAGKGKS